ncbi:hypothetical protein P4H66_03065 [Paenibacillus dokdonensis]|uniref:Uncharacterized protein n=1 Tax=Paenibacillus dokdonensis TaxID=2567944 RepID=A0ABU6GGJ4_9BACL|nr:hypothetical protein [Paenibacillus dokdonensis]MEC0238851.1 hypothetical protein [Paenibacillus dokdonensis]
MKTATENTSEGGFFIGFLEILPVDFAIELLFGYTRYINKREIEIKEAIE